MTGYYDGAADSVMGTAARNILNGYVPDGKEHWCCGHLRCWHFAAAILFANGLRRAAADAPADVPGRLF